MYVYMYTQLLRTSLKVMIVNEFWLYDGQYLSLMVGEFGHDGYMWDAYGTSMARYKDCVDVA